MMRAVFLSVVCVVGLGLGARAAAEGSAEPAVVAPADGAGEEAPVSPPDGWLEVNSQPWSLVEFDGVEAGRTPLKSQRLEPGVHAVEFVCSTCSPPRRHRELVVVEEGRTRSVVHRFDDGWTRTRSLPLPEQEPVMVPVPPPPMERMLVHEGQPSGALLVNTKPWSRVSLNDYDLGAVPLDVTVTPGEYVVTLSCEVCEPPQTRTERVVVSLDDTTKLIVVFD